MQDETAIEMFVGGLVLDPNTQAPVVVLKDESGDVHLPIWIGLAEATSIASAIKEVDMARPLTHDLMTDIFQELSVRVERIVITELKDSTYYAELILGLGEKALIFDSRPSDAIAIALRTASPIYVAREVLNQAQIRFGQEGDLEEPSSEQGDEGGASGEEGSSGEEQPETDYLPQDFKSIDKEKWSEMLADLDPEDFKYKT